MAHIIKTIQAINPNAVVIVTNNDVNQIEWLEGTQPIDKQLILNKQLELQSIEDTKVLEKQTAKDNAINKLAQLGLTEQEVKALLNI
jgi:hypothetical protein